MMMIEEFSKKNTPIFYSGIEPARLAVIIPIYNEAENIRPLVARLEHALSGISWEAIFVDDDSPDRGSEVARALGAHDPRIRCLRRVGRRGLASACIEGFLATSAPFVAVIDGDLQHDESILPSLLASRAARRRVASAPLAIRSARPAPGSPAGSCRFPSAIR